GDYKFDPLNLLPRNAIDRRFIQEAELNNGRLAMMAMAGLIVQEYLTGVPSMQALADWLGGDAVVVGAGDPGGMGDLGGFGPVEGGIPNPFDFVNKLMLGGQ
ncbi:hypothetical protein B484DRAFT_323545, partial [Ochromonadaceae sp. CCMP2298]